jgi:hypothetical protein
MWILWLIQKLNATCLALPPAARLVICDQVQAWVDGMRETCGVPSSTKRPAEKPFVDTAGWPGR